MPTRNFCDRGGEEIPTDEPYYLVEMKMTNHGGYDVGGWAYHPEPTDRYGQKVYLKDVRVNMLCEKCAKEIALVILKTPAAE